MLPKAQVERARRAFALHRRLRHALAVELERAARETERALHASIALRFSAIRQREKASAARLFIVKHDGRTHEGLGTDEKQPQDAGR